MLVVLGSRLDPSARALVAHWSSADAALLSAEDLCRPGWVHRPMAPLCGTAVVDGRRVPVGHIDAVLVRRPAVLAEELTSIHEDDRDYVAAEINAFLVAWLSGLDCAVVNRPSPRSLDGPGWSVHHWRAAAMRVGLVWGRGNGDSRDVVVCAGECVGAASDAEVRGVRRLAAAAGVDVLGVRIGRDGVTAASTLPPLEGEARDLVLAHLLRRVRCRIGSATGRCS
jgi:hypothetical protein